MTESDDQKGKPEDLTNSEDIPPLSFHHENPAISTDLTPINEAEQLCLTAVRLGQSIWLDPDLVNTYTLDDTTIRPDFCNQILRQIFQRRQENQDITSIYEWTNLNGPFTERELALVETTMALDKTQPFASQMRPAPDQIPEQVRDLSKISIRAEFLLKLTELPSKKPSSGLVAEIDNSAATAGNKISISGALIIGKLDLTYKNISTPFELTYCLFEETPDFSHSKLAHLDLSGSYCPGLRCNGSTINGNITLSKGYLSDGKTEFINCSVNGSFTSEGGRFHSAIASLDEEALTLELTHIKNSLQLINGFEATGRVNMRGLKCDLDIICNGASIINQQQEITGHALIFDNAIINGNIKIGENFTAEGNVTCCGLKVGGNFEAVGGSFQSFSGSSKTNTLHFQNCQINNNLILLYANIIGRFTIENTAIKGNCDLGYIAANNSTNSNNGQALKINNCQINGSLLLAEATLKGQTYIRDTSVGNTLDCSFSILENVSVKNMGQALIIENSSIGHNFLMAYGFSAKGHITANHLKVGHDLICNGGHFRGDLTLQNSQIAGTLSLDNNEDPTSNFEEQINFINLNIDTYGDDERSWPKIFEQENFTYHRFLVPKNNVEPLAKIRSRWLAKQSRVSPEATRKAINAFRTMGKTSDAKTLELEFAKTTYWQNLFQPTYKGEDQASRTPMQNLSIAVKWPFYTLWWLIYGFWMGYGYHFQRILITSILVFLISASLYSKATRQALISPASPTPEIAEKLSTCNQQPLSTSNLVNPNNPCEIPELPTFSPLLYSLENQVPLLNLNQKTKWQVLEKSMALHIPSPSCLQLIKTCMVTKWVPFKTGKQFLVNLQRLQSIFGLAAIMALLYILLRPALRGKD